MTSKVILAFITLLLPFRLGHTIAGFKISLLVKSFDKPALSANFEEKKY